MTMKIKLLCLFCLLALFFVSSSSIEPSQDKTEEVSPLSRWQAGREVTPSEVESYGIERCFVAEEISDEVFSRMWKKSYKENCTIPRTDLRYIKVLHYTAEGKIKTGEMVCNKLIAKDLVEIFRELYDARYPIERMVLVDNYNAQDEPSMTANNTSCFNFRFIQGTKRLSNHSRGLAIDINTLYNPCVKKLSNGTTRIEPKAGKQYANRTKKFDYKISRNDLCYKLFIKHGFRWGGDWNKTKDYQHFEKKF